MRSQSQLTSPVLGQVIQREVGGSPSQLHSNHLLIPSNSPSPWLEPFSYHRYAGVLPDIWGLSILYTNLFHPIPPGTRPVVRPWQVKGPTGMHPFFSYSNQWWPSFVSNQKRWDLSCSHPGKEMERMGHRCQMFKEGLEPCSGNISMCWVAYYVPITADGLPLPALLPLGTEREWGAQKAWTNCPKAQNGHRDWHPSRTDRLKSPNYEKLLSAHGYSGSSNPVSSHWSRLSKLVWFASILVTDIFTCFSAFLPLDCTLERNRSAYQHSSWHIVHHTFAESVKTK